LPGVKIPVIDLNNVELIGDFLLKQAVPVAEVVATRGR